VRALVTGVTGQTGWYLAEHLVATGHEVFGVVRGQRLAPAGVVRIHADLLDQPSLEYALNFTQPDEVYHLAAVTAPGKPWGAEQPPLLADVTALGTVRLLDAVLKVTPWARVVCASSSAVFDPHRYGLYGIAKQFAHEAVAGYRAQLHVSNAVLYSHTSPRQDPRFLAPTIARTVAAGGKLVLSDLDGRRDWGYAGDFARALPLIARAEPGDYTVATGETHSVRDFVTAALLHAGAEWGDVVDHRPGTPTPPETPADVGPLLALGWAPESTFDAMVRLMVDASWT
jgi:GDPmannose 4,6-dehydratase